MFESIEERTPLERALEKGSKQILECFLKAGIDPNMRDKNDNTILYNSIKNKQSDIVSVLLKYKANPNILNMNGDSALHLATRLNDIKTCNLLLSHGAQLTVKNVRNQLPISIAIKESLEDLVELFIKTAPEILDIKDQAGKYIVDSSSESMKIYIKKIHNWRRRAHILYCKNHCTMLSKLPEGVFKSLVLFL